MQCNIDSKGKAVRLIGGLITLTVAAVLAVLTLIGTLPPIVGWIAAGTAAAGGAFQVYEGWAGWCVVRALGFKTPI